MGGYRIMRTTKNTALEYDYRNTPVFIGVAGNLKIPSAYAAVNDSGGEYNGVFPEFFYGFYSGYYGIDIGLIFRDQQWQVFAQSPNALSGPGWQQETIPTPLNPDDLILFQSYLGGPYLLHLDVIRGGVTLKNFTVNLTSAAYNQFKSGSYINREMNIATNLNKDYVQSCAYFTNAQWSGCTLTTNIWNYVAWTDAFGDVIIGKDKNDDKEIEYTEVFSFYPEMVGGFIKDTGSIDFREAPVCPQ